MKKVALQIVSFVSIVVFLSMLSACNKSSGNNNPTYCNANGQCYNTNMYNGNCSSEYVWEGAPGNSQCWDRIQNHAADPSQCSAAGAPPLGTSPYYNNGYNGYNPGFNNGYNPFMNSGIYSPYCNPVVGPAYTNFTGMPYQFSGQQFATTGACGPDALMIVDPTTGVTQCAPMASYNSFAPYATPTAFPGYYGGGGSAGAFLYINGTTHYYNF